MSTNISWVVNPGGSRGETWNPVVGCTHAGSPGCDNCYAEELHNKRHKAYLEGKLQDLPQYAKPFEVVQCLPERLDAPLHWKKPRTVFVNSVSDLFHEDVPFEFFWRVLDTVRDCPQHTFIALTKRADVMLERCRRAYQDNLPYDNLYLGLSVSTQTDWDRQAADFLAVPGKKIISAEPLLGPLDLLQGIRAAEDDWERVNTDGDDNEPPEFVTEAEAECDFINCSDTMLVDNPEHREWVRWREWAARMFALERQISGVIAGCESGKNARPMHPDWVRSLKDQCAAAGVPFYCKQWGEWAPLGQYDNNKPNGHLPKCILEHAGYTIGSPDDPDPDGMVENAHFMIRVGVKAAGRLLDGVIHTALPWREEVQS